MKVVLFHKNCKDGLFSAFSFWKKYGCKDVMYIEINYKPIQDMEPMEALEYIFNGYIKKPCSLNSAVYEFKDNKVTVEDMKDMELYVVDYSFPVKHFKTYIPLFKSILVLDHHKTAIDEYTNQFYHTEGKNGWMFIKPSENSEIVFSTHESGAKLTYMFLNEDKEVPSYIELISDRDLWTFKLENSKKFHHGLMLHELNDFNVIDTLMNSFLNDIVNIGGKYEVALLERIEKIIRSNVIDITVKIAGQEYKCGLVNSYLDIASDLCDSVIYNHGYDISIAYTMQKNADVSCSVRSRKGIDSSKISLMYGGGGHANSSGFHFSLDELNSVLKKKFIIVAKKPSWNFLNKIVEKFKCLQQALFRV